MNTRYYHIFNKAISKIALSIVLLSVSCKVSIAQQSHVQNEGVGSERPNIVLIMTDQHQARALSSAGNLDVKTPNIDKLAKKGVRFENSYVTFPLCTPSRSSIFTGKMPHSLGVNSNKEGDNIMNAKDKKKGLGNVLSEAGYDCVYAGKWHAHEAEMSDGNGFTKIAGFGDIPLAKKCIDYLSSKKDGKNPFFLVASFDNPHNICEWARNEPLPYGNIANPSLDKLPKLPKNFSRSLEFPEALQIEQAANPRVYPTKNYTENDWRQYRYTYYSLIEKVDHEIGKIIDAIDDLGLSDNTVIIFTSDHGDGNASHGWNQKTALFQESVNVPMIISHKNIKNPGSTDKISIISNGLDIYPTVCDLAHVTLTEKMMGKSLKPLLEGEETRLERDYTVVETKFEGKQASGTMGRAVIGKKYKYIVYSWGKNREQFFDIENDSLETQNLIGAKMHGKKIDDFRQKLLDWCKMTNDTKFLRKLVLPTNSTLSSSDLFDKHY